MCVVVVRKTSYKHGNHPILRGGGSSHHTKRFFLHKKIIFHDFSSIFNRFFHGFCGETQVVDPKRLTHTHSHRDLNSLSLSTEYIPLGTHTVNLLEDRTDRTPVSTRRHLEL